MKRLTLLAVALAVLAAPTAAAADPAALVDPFIGTEGNGHTFPGADVPFGMVQFSPVTVAGGPGGYRYSELRLSGFAVTRLSGAGCTNFGDVRLMPVASPPAGDPTAVTAAFSHGAEQAGPGSYQVRLADGVSAALTVTTRTGLGVFAYPRGEPQGTLLVEASAAANHRSAGIRLLGRDRIVGSSTSAAFGGACGHPPGRYTVYFALAFSRPFAHAGVWPGGNAYASFDTRSGAPVEVKVGISYVSIANALGNLAAEATSWSFATVQARARSRWNSLLRRVRVSGGTADEQRVFATAIYHALLFPSVFSDANGQYLGEDGKVHAAAGYTQYTNVSGWDLYRGEMQLLAFLAPREASDVVRSLLADAQQTGQLPKWPVASAETGLMIGDPSDAIIADAYAFGARGFDAGLALQQMLAGASVPQPAHAGYVERPALAAYLAHGYIPGAAATTLEYAIADFAIAQLAGALGDQTDAQTMLGRSADWQQTFDAQTGFAAPRLGDGSFPAKLDPTSTTGFVEGDGWQYTFLVPQNMGGLLAALGPPGSARQRLDRFFARLNAGPTAPNAWLGNEPSFFIPYAYLWLGQPWRSEDVVHRALTTLFTTQPSGLPGNDDLGALSAWYVWSALGVYPVIPGVPGFAVVAPLFPHATVELPSGATLHLDAAGGGRYVRSLTLDGSAFPASWLPLAQVAGGARLRFTLGPTPSSWGTTSTPPSFAPGE
jgi:predicted alpha-1,2-mannosidase